MRERCGSRSERSLSRQRIIEELAGTWREWGPALAALAPKGCRPLSAGAPGSWGTPRHARSRTPGCAMTRKITDTWLGHGHGARCRVRTCQTPVEHQVVTERDTPQDTLEPGTRAGFEVCEVIRAWTKLPEVLRAAVLAIVRSHLGDLSTNRGSESASGAKVAAARAPKGNSSRAGAKPELPVCGQVGRVKGEGK